MARGIAQRLQLLEVSELPDVHLLGEMAADRLLERLTLLVVPAGEGPGAGERVARALPHERLQRAASDLEDYGERDVCRRGSGRLDHELSTLRLKLPE